MDEQLLAYFATREQQRTDAVTRVLEGMTERERRIAREAAVMGYVQGVKNGPYRDKVPHDVEILNEVVDGCLAFSDLYPVIGGGQ